MITGRFTAAHCGGSPSAGAVEVVAAELEEAHDRGVLVIEPLGGPARMHGGALLEVLEAALGVVGELVDVREVLLGADDAQGRPALGERAGAADRSDDSRRSGADSATGMRRWAGSLT